MQALCRLRFSHFSVSSRERVGRKVSVRPWDVPSLPIACHQWRTLVGGGGSPPLLARRGPARGRETKANFTSLKFACFRLMLTKLFPEKPKNYPNVSACCERPMRLAADVAIQVSRTRLRGRDVRSPIRLRKSFLQFTKLFLND